MKWTNYHNHCHYCDGKDSVDAHVRAAIDQGIFSLGFTCHSPVPFENDWSMPLQQINNYFDEINSAKNQYQDKIQLYKSLEIDFIPGIITPTDDFIKSLNLDYTLGSVHFVSSFEDGQPWEIDGSHNRFLSGLRQIFHNDIEAVIRKYYELIREMVRNACPEVIGHLDKIKMQNLNLWDEKSAWYRNEILHTLEEIRATPAIIEINTRGIYKKLSEETYPGDWVLAQIEKMNIPVQINSDAHHPREISMHFSQTAEKLRSFGIKNVMILQNGEWINTKLDKNGLKM